MIARLENLERRLLLDSSPFAQITASGTVIVNATSAGDSIQLTASLTQITVMMNGASLQFRRTLVKRLYVSAFEGNDVVSNNVPLNSTILGGDGSDWLHGGPGFDSIDGGAGDDTVNGGAGNDNFAGGPGNDLLEYGDRTGGFNFVLEHVTPGPPEESVLIGAIHVFRNDGESDNSTDLFESIGGTEFADTFESGGVSSAQPITLWGRGGADRFGRTSDIQALVEEGGAGNDEFDGYVTGMVPGVSRPTTLIGGSGDDVFTLVETPALISGGSGSDTVRRDELAPVTVIDLNQYVSIENASGHLITVIGTNGPNRLIQTSEPFQVGTATLLGNDGDDTIVGGPGPDSIDGGAGDDSIIGGGGLDTIYGGDGNDSLTGGSAGDSLDGGAGDDLLQGGGGADTIRGGDGDDVIAGNSGNDKLYGGFGKDTVIGGAGRDRIYGDSGNDLLLARDRQRDTLYGGDGTDQAIVDDRPDFKDLWGEIETLL